LTLAAQSAGIPIVQNEHPRGIFDDDLADLCQEEVLFLHIELLLRGLDETVHFQVEMRHATRSGRGH
jgi:hypothetical protein